jgi:hypothetical protein
MDSEKIKITAHSALLKFGSQSDFIPQLKDTDIGRDAIAKGITTIGFDLTYAQERALHAIQVLLYQTDYKGNMPSVIPAKNARYHFPDSLPVLRIKTAEYLVAYGVDKSKTYRGMEFSAQGSRVAKNALRDLAMNERLIVYEKSREEKNKDYRHVEDIAPLIALEILNGGKALQIIPNPVLVDQVDSYFLLRPINIFDLIPGKDVVAVRFIEYLMHQGEMKRRDEHAGESHSWEIRIQQEGLAWKLRLGAVVRARKKTELRTRMNALYELGITLGYLDSYAVDQQGTKGRILEVLNLNPNKFRNLVPSGAESGPNSSKT